MAKTLRENLTKKEIVSLLKLTDFGAVYEEAERVRAANVGNDVLLRAIIEFSNVCSRKCTYCGLRSANSDIKRYRMSEDEILESAREAVAAGYRTIVLQSGEDEYFTKERVVKIIGEIKSLRVVATGQPPAVTLGLGERPYEHYRAWKEAGADRYLLKHETADEKLYNDLHPCGKFKDRKNCLLELKGLGYETGSGFMVGLPGQTIDTLAKDLMLLKEIGCHMAGIGPFIPNPKTPLGDKNLAGPDFDRNEMTKRCVALARILLPKANLPITTALAVNGEKNMDFGANVIMKKVTPDKYRDSYEIYPAGVGSANVKENRRMLEETIERMGRTYV